MNIHQADLATLCNRYRPAMPDMYQVGINWRGVCVLLIVCAVLALCGV